MLVLTLDLPENLIFLFLRILCHLWCCCSFSPPTCKYTFAHLESATQQHHKRFVDRLQLPVTLMASASSWAIGYRRDESPGLCHHSCFRNTVTELNVTDQNWKKREKKKKPVDVWSPGAKERVEDDAAVKKIIKHEEFSAISILPFAAPCSFPITTA